MSFRKLLLWGGIAALTAGGCGKSKVQPTTAAAPPAQAVKAAEPEEETIPRVVYTYEGAKYRDPFQPVFGGALRTAEAPSEEQEGGFSPGRLRLSGIITGPRSRLATLQDSAGNRYLLQGGKIFDQRGKPISGVAGVIRQNRVTVLSATEKVDLVLKPRAKEASP